MKLKYFLVTAWIIPALALAGCAVLKKPVQLVDHFIDSTLFPPYSGPKANLVIADFDIKAAKATSDAGLGLRDMLITGLNNTSRFEVVSPRSDSIEKGPGLIIATEVVDFEPRASGGSEGVGGGGSAASGTLGSLLGVRANKSSVALNIRIVDPASSKVLFAERISAEALDTATPSSRQGRSRASALNDGLAVYVDTPMEGAINKCVAEAIKYITQKVPASYYKTNEAVQADGRPTKGEQDGKTQTQGKA